MHEALIQNITDIVPLSEKEIALVESSFKPIRLKKKQFLLQKGELSNHMRFIAEGCVRLYNIDETGREHILQFGIKGWWMNDLYAYLTEKPATYFIQAISNSIVLQIHRDQLNLLFDNIHMMDRFFRIKTQNGYVALQERAINSMSQTAAERYSDFVSRYREMEQQSSIYARFLFRNYTRAFKYTSKKSYQEAFLRYLNFCQINSHHLCIEQIRKMV